MKCRLRKKLEKRRGCWHYKDVQQAVLIDALKQKYPDANMLIFQTSRSGRKLEKIICCLGTYPSNI